MPKFKNITIFGFADAHEDRPVWKDAYNTAKLLAEHGYTIVNGGGPGVMKAATLGAKEANGKVIGVSFYPKDAPYFEGRDKSNPVDQEIKATNYLERTLRLLDIGDAYVIFQGGTGTISEFGMVWGLARLYFGHHKPFILYGSFWHEILEAIAKNMYIRGEELRVYRIVDTPKEVLEEIRKFEGESAGSLVY
ncbi:MAG: LOG family protein [candidate division WWE3 bacterium]|nr:LOG family protein [candidate division WWE3 bacterium]